MRKQSRQRPLHRLDGTGCKDASLASAVSFERAAGEEWREHDRGTIDRYLAELRQLTEWHPDHQDVLDESEDHLRTRADVLEQVQHLTRERAETEAVEAFGAPEAFALQLARSRSGQLAMPRPGTRAAGLAALIATPLLACASVIIIAAALGIENEPLFYALLWTMTLGLAGLAAGLVGLIARIGAAPPIQAACGFAAAMWAALWGSNWHVWMAASVLLTPGVAVLIHRSRCITRRQSYLLWPLVAAWPAAAGVAGAIYWSGLDSFDPSGFDLGFVWAAATGVVLMTIGSASLGHQLLSERPGPKQLLPEPPAPGGNPFAPGRQSGLAVGRVS